MSEPHAPNPDTGGEEQRPRPPQAGAQPPTESEPAPSAASPDLETGRISTERQPTAQSADSATVDQPPAESQSAAQPPPGPIGGARTEQMFQQAPPAGHYVWVPDGGRRRAFGPAMGRFVRHHGTHLVAAVVVGAVVGGGTVAIVDNVANRHQPSVSREGQTGGPFGGGSGHRFPGFQFGQGGQGSGN